MAKLEQLERSWFTIFDLLYKKWSTVIQEKRERCDDSRNVMVSASMQLIVWKAGNVRLPWNTKYWLAEWKPTEDKVHTCDLTTIDVHNYVFGRWHHHRAVHTRYQESLRWVMMWGKSQLARPRLGCVGGHGGQAGTNTSQTIHSSSFCYLVKNVIKLNHASFRCFKLDVNMGVVVAFPDTRYVQSVDKEPWMKLWRMLQSTVAMHISITSSSSVDIAMRLIWLLNLR